MQIDELKEKQKIEDYLLHKLAEEDRERLEKRLFAEDDYFDFFSTVEIDLQEKYLDGNLSESDRFLFDTKFLSTDERKKELWLTRSLRKEAAMNSTQKSGVIKENPAIEKFSLKRFFAILVPSFTCVLLLVGGIYWWTASDDPNLEKGLAYFKKAYSSERPLQSRLSDLEYAPFSQTRGNSKSNNSNEITLAEKYLLEAATTNPGFKSYHALGKYYLSQSNFEKAITNFQEAKKIDPRNAYLNNDLAVTFLEKGKLEKSKGETGEAAIDFANGLELLTKSLSDKPDSPVALFNRAFIYQYLMLPEKAADDWRRFLELDPNSQWSDEARQQLKGLEDRKLQSSLSSEEVFDNFTAAFRNGNANQAWQAIKLSRTRSGIDITEKIIDDFLSKPPNYEQQTSTELEMLKFAGNVAKQNAGDFFLSDQAKFYSTLKSANFDQTIAARRLFKEGQSHYGAGKYQIAADSFAQSKMLFEQNGNSPEALVADTFLGFSQLRIPENILERLKKLAQIFDKNKYLSLQAQSLLAIADNQSTFSEKSEAIISQTQAINIAQKAQDYESIIRGFQGSSSLQREFAKYQDSLETFFSMIEENKEVPLKPNVLWNSYMGAALNFQQLGFHKTAAAYQEKHLILAEEAKNPQLKSRSLEQLALFKMLNRDFDNAIKDAQSAVYIWENSTDEKAKLNISSRVSLLLGDIYRKKGDYQKSLEYYQNSEDSYRKMDFPSQFYQIFRGKALSYIALNDTESAKRSLDESIAKYEEFRKKIYEESNRNSFFDTEQGIYDVAIDFAFTKLKDPVQALDYSEMSRARSLLDLLQSKQIASDDVKDPELYIKAMSSPINAAELQTHIPNDTQLLEFAVLENKIVAWVINNNSIEATETVISSQKIEELTKNYSALLKTNKIEELNNTAKELYQLLITPNESRLDANKRLFIVSDKSLNFLPFGALVNPETNQYLVEKFTVGISPSLNIFAANTAKNSNRKMPENERLLAIGNPSFSKEKFKELDYLPDAINEVNKIAGFYTNSQIFVNKEAEKTKILQELNDSNVIHFALHALTNDKNPLLSGLVLTDSSIEGADMLRSFEIYRQKLPNTQLVVISACDTGIEKTFSGEGAIGLARPFIALGIPTVIASLWKVESLPTSELMVNFHRGRKSQQLNDLAALRKAQIDMIKSNNPQFRHPNSWASFIAIGN